MSQVETAMLILLGATIGLALILFGVWHLRRNPAIPGETRLSRKPRAAEVPVEISAARLARISGKPAPENPIDAALQSLAADVERQAHRTDQPLGG